MLTVTATEKRVFNMSTIDQSLPDDYLDLPDVPDYVKHMRDYDKAVKITTFVVRLHLDKLSDFDLLSMKDREYINKIFNLKVWFLFTVLASHWLFFFFF